MSLSGKTLVCFAMGSERRPFRPRPVAPPDEIRVMVSGVGPRNARRGIEQALAAGTPDRVLTCGFAGGLDPAFGLGDVLFETSDRELSGAFLAAGARPAQFHCSDRIATTVVEKRSLFEATGAGAVEMESAVIHEVCVGRGIPCATLRSISDTALDSMPLDFNTLAAPDQSLSPAKLAWAILRNPGAIPGLMRLGSRSSLAARRLAATLEALLIRR